jgi:hypothetical protein
MLRNSPLPPLATSLCALDAEIRVAMEIVPDAERALSGRDMPTAILLQWEAEEAYAEILLELTQLSERDALLVEPAFTELEIRLQGLAHWLTAASSGMVN